jgi:hypothetical protein
MKRKHQPPISIDTPVILSKAKDLWKFQRCFAALNMTFLDVAAWCGAFSFSGNWCLEVGN